MSPSLSQASLELMIFLPHPTKFWDDGMCNQIQINVLNIC